jgi:hypothetical protein
MAGLPIEQPTKFNVVVDRTTACRSALKFHPYPHQQVGRIGRFAGKSGIVWTGNRRSCPYYSAATFISFTETRLRQGAMAQLNATPVHRACLLRSQ